MDLDKDYLEFLTNKVVEEKLGNSIKKSSRRSTILFISIMVLILVSIICTKNFIGYNLTSHVNQAIESVTIDLDTKYNQLINKKLLYVTVVSDLAIVSHGSEISGLEIDRIIEKLHSLYINYQNEPELDFEFLLFRLANLLAEASYTKYLMQIDNLFEQIIASSKQINPIFANYYGRKVLLINNQNQEEMAVYYQQFTEHINNNKQLGDDNEILPILILVSFHISGQMRNENCDELMNYINGLSIREKASFIVHLINNINISHHTIDEYTIAQTTELLLKVYKNEIEQIVHSNGVKESILEWYKKGNAGYEKSELYQYVLNYLYQLGL